MPPKGYKTVTLPVSLVKRLEAMKKGTRARGIAECIEQLLRFTIY